MDISPCVIKIIFAGFIFFSSMLVKAERFYCETREVVGIEETSLTNEIINVREAPRLKLEVSKGYEPIPINTNRTIEGVLHGNMKIDLPMYFGSPIRTVSAVSMKASFSIDQDGSNVARVIYLNPSRNPSPYRTIPDQKIDGLILGRVGNKDTATLLADFLKSKDNKCTRQITNQYQLAFNAIDAREIYEKTKKFVSNEEVFRLEHSQDVFEKYKKFVFWAGELLDKCYIPAESSDFVRRHNALQVLGSISHEGTPFCTGTLVKSGNHVLTARHCFQFFSNLELQKNLRGKFWFKLAGSSDEYQVCAVVGKSALNGSKFEKAIDDQVMVRIASPVNITTTINLIQRDELKAVTKDTTVDKPPTKLIQISLFPFSSLVRPGGFKSGFVQGANPACVALSKEAGCFAHTCSAIRGGSGASIFLAEAETMSLVGTHIGDSEMLPDCKAPQHLQVNAATYIESALKGN